MKICSEHNFDIKKEDCLDQLLKNKAQNIAEMSYKFPLSELISEDTNIENEPPAKKASLAKYV